MLNNPVIIQAPQGDIKFPVYTSTITVRNSSSYRIKFYYPIPYNNAPLFSSVLIDSGSSKTLYGVLPGFCIAELSILVSTSNPFVLADGRSSDTNILTDAFSVYTVNDKFCYLLAYAKNPNAYSAATFTIT